MSRTLLFNIGLVLLVIAAMAKSQNNEEVYSIDDSVMMPSAMLGDPAEIAEPADGLIREKRHHWKKGAGYYYIRQPYYYGGHYNNYYGARPYYGAYNDYY